MKEMQVFSNPKFGEINVLVIDGDIWFIANEIAKSLGYERSNDAIKTHVDKEDRKSTTLYDAKVLNNTTVKHRSNPKGNPKRVIINESGLYSLILSSKLSGAKKFKRWITSEVLPDIRKHGAYLTPEKAEEILLNPDAIIKIATALKEERQKTAELKATNEALTKSANQWDHNAIINALVRSYGINRCAGNFIKAWNVFYKRLNYSLHINLRQRKSEEDKPKERLINLIKEEEMQDVLRLAVAMCEEANIDTGSVINQTNFNLVMNH